MSADFQLRAHAGAVELTTLGGTDGMRILLMPPALARRLAVNLEMFAERAELLERDPDADVPREGTVSDA